MALKDILVQVDETRGHQARLALAAALASRSDAHLTGLFVIEPISFSALAAPGGPDFAAAEAFQAIQREHREARLKLGERLGALFSDAADRAGVSSEWRVVDGDAATAVVLHARYADLAVLGQADPDNPPLGAGVVEAVLLGSGRPVLVVPYARRRDARQTRAGGVERDARGGAGAERRDAAARPGRKVTVLSVNPERGIDGEGDLPCRRYRAPSGAARRQSRGRPHHGGRHRASATSCCRAPPISAPTSLSWAAMAIRARANSFSAAPPGSCCGT